MRPSQQKQIQRPLQNEIVTLHRLLGGEILEQAARILDHFTAMESSKLERGSFSTPAHLSAKLLEKCDQFETVCDQVYYILEQSKRALQLDWQQKKLAEQQKPLHQQQQQGEKTQLQGGGQGSGAAEDMGTDLSLSQVDLTMDDASQLMDDIHRDGDDPQQQQLQQEADSMLVDEDDMDELLQMQRERLERLRNVVVHGVDVETIKASQSQGKDDLLF